MKKGLILILLGVIVLGVIFFKLKPFKRDENKNNDQMVINNLPELFPDKGMTFNVERDGNEYQLKVTSVTKEGDDVIVLTEYEIKNDDETITAEMLYKIMPEKIIESGKHIVNGKVVSTIYPTEILVGMPYENMSWKSVDGLITNTITSMKDDRLIIESVRVIDVYDEETNSSVKKNYKETRILEKGKGIILYSTEIVNEN
jgi:hypothetical protein